MFKVIQVNEYRFSRLPSMVLKDRLGEMPDLSFFYVSLDNAYYSLS